MNLLRCVIELSNNTLCTVKQYRRRIRPPHGSKVIKLNLGCGLAVAKEWINIDGSLNALIATWPRFIQRIFYRMSGASSYYSEAEYLALLGDHTFVHYDLSHGIPFTDGSADIVYSSHFLEHLQREDALKLLTESYRVLKTGGIVRICIPDLEYAVALYAKGEKEKMLDNYFFIDDKDSNFARHKYMYDFELIEKLLRQVGFRETVRCEYQKGAVPDLHSLDNRPEDTLYVESKK